MCGAAVGCSNIAYPKLVVELMPSGRWGGGHFHFHRCLLHTGAACAARHGLDVGGDPVDGLGAGFVHETAHADP